MPRKKKLLKEDPKRIKKALSEGRIDTGTAEPLKWAFMGDLIRFCEKVKVLEILNEATGNFERKSIPLMGKFLLIYIIRLLVGIPNTRGIKELLADYWKRYRKSEPEWFTPVLSLSDTIMYTALKPLCL